MPNIKKLSEYVKKTHPTLPMTAIYLAIYCHFSELLCFNRVKIETPLFSVFPNVYGITFMPSNAGKDYIKKIISEVTEFEENKELECEKIYFNQLEELKRKAEDLDITKQSKEKYIRDNEPRQIVTDSSNATIEGMLAMREAMSDVNIGHCNFSHSEFGKFISNKNNSSDILLTYLMEAYDGDTKAKIIQGKKKVKPIKGVPQTMFVHSAITGFIDNETATNELKSFLETGLGRRSFLCFPSFKEFGEPVDVSENFIEYYAELDKEKNELKDIFREIYKTIKAKLNNYKDIHSNIYKKMTFADDAFKYYLKYRYDCQVKGKNCISELKGEIEGRHWKTIRLAGVCAIIEGKEIIDLDSIKTAITVAEGYGKQIENFYKSIDFDVLRNLFEFILNHSNSSKTDIRNSGVFENKKDTRMIDQCLIDLENYCYDKGYNLVIDIKLNKYKYYSIIKQEEPQPIEEVIEEAKEIELNNPNITIAEFLDDFVMDDKIIQIGEVNKIHYLYNKETMNQYLEKNQHSDIYFLANVNKEKQLNRAKDSDIEKKNYVYFDFDVRKDSAEITDEEIKKTGLVWGERLKKDEETKDWKYIVFSGNGLHIYYKCDDTVINKDNYAVGYELLLHKIKTITKANGIDSACKNPARIGRLPFTNNCKKEIKRPVEIIAFNDVKSKIIQNILDKGEKEKQRQEEINKEDEAMREKKRAEGNYATDELLKAINALPIQNEILKDYPTWELINNKNFVLRGTKIRASSAFLSERHENTLMTEESRWFASIRYKAVGTFLYRREFSGLNNYQTFEYFKKYYNL